MNVFKKIDIFASHYQLKFKNEGVFQTKLGGLLTLIIAAISIAVAVSSGDRIYNRSRPQINRNLVQVNTADKIPLFEFLPFYYYSISDKIFDESYVTLSMNSYNRIIKINETTGEKYDFSYRTKIDIERCSDNLEFQLSRFNLDNHNFTDSLLSNYFEESICLSNTANNREIILGGEYTSGYFTSIYLEVSRCTSNVDSNVICQPNEIIDNEFKSSNFALFFINYLTDADQFDFPYYLKLDTANIKIDVSFYYHVSSYFYPIEIVSDTGLLFTSNKEISRYTVDRLLNIKSSFIPSDESLLKWYISIDTQIDTYHRYYMKLQELAAIVGGIVKVLMVISAFVCNYFSQYLQEELMINTFFSPNSIYSSNKFTSHNKYELDKHIFLSFDGGINEHELKSKINLFQNNADSSQVKSNNYIQTEKNNDKDLSSASLASKDEDSNKNKVPISHNNIVKNNYLDNIINSEYKEYKDKNKDNEEVIKKIIPKINNNINNINYMNNINDNFINNNAVNKSYNGSIKNDDNNNDNIFEIPKAKCSTELGKHYIRKRASSNLLVFKKSILFSSIPTNNINKINELKSLDKKDTKDNRDKKDRKTNPISNPTNPETNEFYSINYINIIGILLCPFIDTCNKRKKYHKLLKSYLLTILDFEEIITESSIFKELRLNGYFNKENKNKRRSNIYNDQVKFTV